MGKGLLLRLREAPVPRVARFMLVGVSGVAVNSGMLWLLKESGGFPLAAASVLAIEAAIWNNFLLNDTWTFFDERRRPWWTRAVAFHATAATAASIKLGLLLVLVTWPGLNYLVANLVAIAAAAVVNYGVSTLWTWGPALPRPRETSESRRDTGLVERSAG